MKPSDAWVACFAALLAALLLAFAILWHIPFMMWDHLELAPMYEGWVAGQLDQTTFWKLQGTGHWHIATYLFLLPSAGFTRGDPWFDCMMSWSFLVAYSWILLHWRSRTLPIHGWHDFTPALLIAFLAFHPGHFFNLQMGWQLAVFQCLFGAAVAIAALSAPHLTWGRNLLALAGTVLGILSFAVSNALFVVAFVLICMHGEIRWSKRALHLVPWVVLALLVKTFTHSAQQVLVHFDGMKVSEYALYYLGSAVARFLPEAASWLAAVALVLLFGILAGIRRWRIAMPWLGLVLFAVAGAALTGVGRGFLGDAASGALVPRYVSFSLAFWIGWIGLLARARADGASWRVGFWTAIVALFAVANAAQLTYQAWILGRDSRSIGQSICREWPDVDKSILDGLIYSGPEAARGYLQTLHDLGFAPFDNCARTTRGR